MKINALLLGLACFFTSQIQSQEYIDMIERGDTSVQEVIDSAEAYFENRDKGRGSGYVQFKRWEYMAKRRMNENGYLTPFNDQVQILEDYNAYLNQTSGTRQQLNDNWQEMGPVDWNATTSWNPGVGRVTGLAVDPADQDHIIIGANTGGVWRTIDGGATWTPLGDFFSNLYVYSVAIDPIDKDTYYFGSRSGLVYKSEDAGATWNFFADQGSGVTNKILIHPTNTDIIFLSNSQSGIYGTTDGGTTWNDLIPSESRGYDIEFKPGDTNTVYASGLDMHVSNDGGLTFTTISGFTGSQKMMGVSIDDPNIVYVVEASGGEFNAFYKSENSGASFTQLNHAGRNYFGYDTAGFDPGGQAPRDMDVTVNPNDVNEVHIAGILTWRSTDGGVTFNCTADWIPGSAANQNIGYHHADVDILEFVGTTLYVGSDGGIFKAEDTANVNPDYYEDLTPGVGIRQFYRIGISQTVDPVITGGSQDNGTSFYTSAEGWRDWLGADGMEGFIDKDDTQVMYGTSQFGQIYRTDDGGQSLNYPSEPGPGSGNWVTPFEQDPIVSNTIYLGYNQVFKSNNKGNTWSAISQNFGNSLDELKIAPSNNQIIYASVGSVLYRTQDGGATAWETMTPPAGLINSIAVHPNNPDLIAVATNSGNKVSVSQDGGETWQGYRLNLPNFSSLAVVWDNHENDGLYVGMDYGIYYIDNSFDEWQPYATNLPNVIINELEINQADGNIYAGSYGRGLWVSPKLDPIILASQNLQDNASFALLPNPASTQVTLVLPEADTVSISIFDITGKLVQYHDKVTITNGYNLSISALETGTYFVRLETTQGTTTQKLLKQ